MSSRASGPEASPRWVR